MEETMQPVNKIGRNFSFWQLIRFVLPTMATQLFLSIFKTVDDGLFVSNYVGKNALAAINIIFPLTMLMDGLIFVFASGGSAVCAHRMGQGKQEEAKRCFSNVVVMTLLFSAGIAGLALLFQKPLLRLLGATDLLMADCVTYSTLIWTANGITMVGPIFDYFYGTAGKPVMSVISSVVNGAVNIVFDLLFIVELRLGVLGAALATTIGNLVFSGIGVIFYSQKKHELYFVKPSFAEMPGLFLETFRLGMSQFFNHVAMSLSSFVANLVMLNLAGEDGVTAYSVIGYLQYMLGSMLFGFADGVAPVFSYNYGAKDKQKIKRYFWYAIRFLVVLSCGIVAVCLIFASPLVSIYINKAQEPELFQMVYSGMHIFPFCFLFSAIGMFAPRFFSSMGDGRSSSFITFMRNGVLLIAATVILPQFWGLTGIWLSMPVGEFLGFLLTLWVFWRNRDNYGYGRNGLALRIDGRD